MDVTAVILGGNLRPSSLRRVLEVPELTLPVGCDRPLVVAWCEALRAAGAGEARVVVNDEADVEAIGRAAGRIRRMRIIAEPAAWRGTAGLLRDVTDDLADEDVIVVAEGACLPPETLAPLLEAIGPDDAGVVGVCGPDEPAGVCAFRREAVARCASDVGYHDVKEQLLPALHREGRHVRTASLGDRVQRIRDLVSYLDAVRTWFGRHGRPSGETDPESSVSSSAIVDGCCLVQPGAVIEDGAVVHDSVIMCGATVCGGAVVTRSVVGPQATVAAREHAVRTIVAPGCPPAAARPARRVARAA